MERVYGVAKRFWVNPTSVIGFVRRFPWWAGILAGAVGAFGPFLGGLLGRIFSGTSLHGDLAAALSRFPAIVLFFLIFVSIQGVVGGLFGGKLDILPFMSDMGWAWFPGALIYVLLIGPLWAAPQLSDISRYSLAYWAVLIGLLPILMAVIWTVRLQVGVLKETLGLSKGRAAWVYGLTAIPGFVLFDLIF